MLENGLPTRDANMRLLRDLLGVPVVVKPADKPLKDPYLLASFLTDENEMAVVCGIDLPLAAHAAASLSQIPKAVAEEMVKAKKVDPAQIDNVREVINIVSSLFNVDKMPHVRLGQMVARDHAAYATMQTFMGTCKARTDHAISIERYGSGTMLFATVNIAPKA